MDDKIILNDIVNWWEKKRLWYNIIVGVIGLLLILDINPSTFNLKDISGVILWGIGANIFYSLGILIEVFDLYYFKGILKISRMRWFFLVTGILVSCYITSINILIYYNTLIIG